MDSTTEIIRRTRQKKGMYDERSRNIRQKMAAGEQTATQVVERTQDVLGAAVIGAGITGIGYGLYRLFGGGKDKKKTGRNAIASKK